MPAMHPRTKKITSDRGDMGSTWAESTLTARRLSMLCRLVRRLTSFSDGVPDVRPSVLIIRYAQWIE